MRANLHGMLATALKQAVAWRLLSINPAAGAETPRAAHREAKVWTPEQARAFLATTDADFWGPAYRVAFATGLRIGELLALKWEDVDLAARTIAVRRSVVAGRDGRWTIGPPKTKASERVVAIPPSSVAALRTQRARQNERRLAAGPAWADEGWVFDRATGDGRIAIPQSARQAFERAVARAGVPPITFHGLRHSHATHGFKRGVPGKIIQERLGHSNLAITMDLYTHTPEGMQQEAAAALDRDLWDGDAELAG